MFNYFLMEVRMNNFSKAIMMALVGMSVVGTDVAAMDLRSGNVYQPELDAPVAPARPKAKKASVKKASAKKTDAKRATTTSKKGVDLQAQIKAAKAENAKLKAQIDAKKAAKAKKAKAVACHQRAWGVVTNVGSTVLNGITYPFVTGYNYLTADAKVAGKKKPAKKQESRFQRTVAFVKAIPSAVWSRLPNRYRAAWGTGAVAATGVAAVQVSPVAGLLVGSIAAGSAYRAYQAGDNKAKKAAPKAKDSKKK